jgi:hypothetical protein
MSQIVDDLRQVAIEIKTETQVGGNTAARVGGAFERVADALEGTQQIEDMDAAVAAVQQAAQENEQTIQDIVNSLAVVQTPGQSTSAVMSQKAVTDSLAQKFDESENIFNIVDSSGKLLAYWDKEGNMFFKRSAPISNNWARPTLSSTPSTDVKGRYYNAGGKLEYMNVNEVASYFGTCEVDVTHYRGKTIFVDSTCSANAYNLFVDEQGTVLDSWQQNSTTIIKKEIPQNANKLLLSNVFYTSTGTSRNDNPSAYFNDELSYILENFGSLSQKEIGIFANDDKSENILNICDTSGNILAYFDKNGEFHANIANIDQDEFKMYLPDTINSYVGDTLQLFKYPMTLLGDYSNYGINLSVNTSNNNIRKYGKDLRRYFEFIPLATGTYNIDANVLNTRQMTILVEKTMTINVLTPTNPSSVKNILCIGDSETEGVVNNSGVTAADGSTSSTRFSWVNEIKARMTTSRTATQTLPAGLGLSNIHFIGTQNTTNGRHEGYGGWDGADFMKSGSPFYINGAVNFNAYLAKDNVYDDTAHKGVDIIYITLGANTTKTLTMSGRKLNLSAAEHKTQIISMLNAINTQLRTDSSKAYYNPNLKVVLLNYVFSWIDGYGYHPYGSGRYNDNCWTSQGYIACFNANNEIAAMDEYKNWVDSVLIAPQVDSEYAYCYINKQKNVYMADTEINHLEAVHPNELGYRMFGAAVMRDLLGRI